MFYNSTTCALLIDQLFSLSQLLFFKQKLLLILFHFLSVLLLCCQGTSPQFPFKLLLFPSELPFLIHSQPFLFASNFVPHYFCLNLGPFPFSLKVLVCLIELSWPFIGFNIFDAGLQCLNIFHLGCQFFLSLDGPSSLSCKLIKLFFIGNYFSFNLRLHLMRFF